MSKSKFHASVSLCMTNLEFREFLTALSIAPETCVYARELACRLYENKPPENNDVIWHYDEDSPAVLAERQQCDEPGCSNPLWEENEQGPDGMCQPCNEKFNEEHHFKDGCWRNKVTGKPSYEK